MPMAPGTCLGPYRVLAKLGEGGMGEVYRARDTRLGRDVAIKVLPPGFAADPGRLRRFEQEARAASALKVDPLLAPLRDDPRFQALLARAKAMQAELEARS